MGVVFKAQDQALDEVVALKLLRGSAPRPGRETDDASQAAALASRFRSEIKLAWKVRHRNVCGIHEYGEDGELLYISMELVEGRDLRRILREKGALLWEEAYDVALQVADGLSAIHEAGVIHRDLKPANIMLESNGVVRLMDFGIAKVWSADSGSGLTGSGHVVGSPEYMSPEQVRDQPLGFTSDVYSLGVVLFELFTGRAPFKAETPVATMLKQLEAAPPLEGPDAARIPLALLPVIRRALAKEADHRYATCAELRRALDGARKALTSQLTDEVPSSGGEGPAAGHSPARLLAPQLVRALRHADPGVRRDAAEALATIGADRDRILGPLREARERDADARVRAAAEAALARLGPEPAAEPAMRSARRPPASPPPTPAAPPTPSAGAIPASADEGRSSRPPAPAFRGGAVALVGGLAVLVALAAWVWRTPEGEPMPRAAPVTTPGGSISETRAPETPVASLVHAELPPSPDPAPSPSSVAAPSISTPSKLPARQERSSAGPRQTLSTDVLPSTVAAPPTLLAGPTSTTILPAAPEPTPVTETPRPTPTPFPVSPPTPRAPHAGDLVLLTDPGVQPPRAKRPLAAAHTMMTERLALEGTVDLRILIDEKGMVADAQVARVESRQRGAEYDRLLREAALKSAQTWRFDPAELGGVPVRVWLEVRIAF